MTQTTQGRWTGMRSDAEMDIVWIEPEVAAEWLQTNVYNRKLKNTMVQRLAGAILRDEWVLNGESIKFDRRGNLIDGQHRLAAIVAAKTAVPALVVRNVADAAQDTVDTGTRRTLSDALRIRQEPKHAMLAAALGWLHRLQSGQITANIQTNQYPTIQQGLALLEENPGMRAAMDVASRLYYATRFPSGLGTALAYVLSSVDEQDAEVFFEHFVTGAGLDEGHPILVLRDTVDRYNNQKPKPGQPYYAAIVVKAWNAYKDGRSIARLSWSPGGSRNERFPETQTY